MEKLLYTEASDFPIRSTIPPGLTSQTGSPPRGDAGYTYVDNPDNADGNISNARVGFYYTTESNMLEWDLKRLKQTGSTGTAMYYSGIALVAVFEPSHLFLLFGFSHYRLAKDYRW